MSKQFVTFFKSDLPSRFDMAQARKRDADRLWRQACQDVDRRDRGTCRCCGKRSDPDGFGILTRGHRHHIIYRSAGGEDSTQNLVTLCGQCHSDEHRNRLRFTCDGTGYETVDADKGLEFWRQDTDGVWFLTRREIAPGVTERD